MNATRVGTPPRSRDRQSRGALLRFGYIYAISLVALPMVLLFMFMNLICRWWFDQFRRPAVEREFGFQSDIREVALPSGAASRRLIITQVVPGGRFDRAGAKPGDLATGCEAARRIRFEGRAITGRREPQNKWMKLTSVEPMGRSQLVPSVQPCLLNNPVCRADPWGVAGVPR